ncbi:MAG TPA: MFS transporter [Rhizomicrobium sp.]|nr:MFS transporter [Rhizomicrobium sp.]
MATRTQSETQMPPSSPRAKLPGSPFRHKAFAVIWTATVVSNVGWWMYTAASGWLMLSLNSAPLVVSLVQVANSLPMFLFAIPAGALTDIVDKRKFLIAGEISIAAVATAFAALVWLHLVTPITLLLFAFLVAAGDALTSPAYQAIVPLLVPKTDLPKAVVANSAGINVSRAVGPALGGALLGVFGIAAPFWINAVSNFGSIGALVWWHEPVRSGARLPPEHLLSAIRSGFRYARYNASLIATLIRAAGFLLFASAYWALLPLVVRNQIGGGPMLYGILLGAIGASAVGGAFLLPWLNDRLVPDRVAAAGTLGTAAATALYGLAHEGVTALAASLLAGVSWMTMLSVLNISAQYALPEWVRGRGLAIYVTVMFGALSLGSAIWGQAATVLGLGPALFIAAAGCATGIPLLGRWRLQMAKGLDLSPSIHWPVPVMTADFDAHRGPVMVMVTYEIDPRNREQFLEALDQVGRERRRDGAYQWQVFEDPNKKGCFVETFLSDSWLDHLRQHERVTNADHAQEDAARKFQAGEGPVTTHFIAARPRRRS